MTVSINNKQSQPINFNGTTRLMKYGYTQRADDINKSLRNIRRMIETKDYDVFVINNNSQTTLFVQEPEKYLSKESPKKIYTIDMDNDKAIHKVAKLAVKEYEKQTKMEQANKDSFFNNFMNFFRMDK